MRRRQFLKDLALAAAAPALGRSTPARAARLPAHTRVVVIGGGFAGSACALSLRAAARDLDVALIDPDESYWTCPTSNEVVVGWRELGSLKVTRQGLRRAGVGVLAARAQGIDADRRRVRLDDGRDLAFDRLVVAPGIRFLWNRIEGYDVFAAQRMPHAWQAGRQTALLAAQLRAMEDGGVVAIAVPSGLMRCPPAPYERATLIAHYLARHKPRSKVLIFDANNHFPRQDAFTEVWRNDYPGRVEWIPVTQNGAVAKVDADTLTLYTGGGAQRVAVANVIAPQAPAAFAPAAGLATGHGWCPVDPVTFESTHLAGVHVIGDACIADAMPKSGSAALSQAAQCAQAVLAALSGRAPPAAEYASVCYALTARRSAVALPGRFLVQAGRIVAAPAAANAQAAAAANATSAANAQAAGRWYREARIAAFGEAMRA